MGGYPDAVTEQRICPACGQPDSCAGLAGTWLAIGSPQRQLSCLARGDDALVNLSRGVLKTADQQFVKMIVLSLTAPSSVLVTRLLERGCESAEQISARLARSGFGLPKGLQVLQVDNSGTLDQTIDTTLSALYSDSPNREIS